jgi:hypothetical protein
MFQCLLSVIDRVFAKTPVTAPISELPIAVAAKVRF